MRKTGPLVLAAVLLLAGCTSAPEVVPQPCEVELTTTSFRICLPADSQILQADDNRAIAQVGDYEVNLLEHPSQEGDPDQAAFAILSRLQTSVGSVVSTASARPATFGPMGPIQVDGVDGAFEALDSAWVRGEVADLIGWGRGVTLGDRSAAALVLRLYDVDNEVSADQLAEGRQAALPLLVTLAPRQD